MCFEARISVGLSFSGKAEGAGDEDREPTDAAPNKVDCGIVQEGFSLVKSCWIDLAKSASSLWRLFNSLQYDLAATHHVKVAIKILSSCLILREKRHSIP